MRIAAEKPVLEYIGNLKQGRHMNDKKFDKSKVFIKSGSYSLCMAFVGLLMYFLYFPSGIYNGFFFGVMAVAVGIVGKRYEPRARVAAGIILGIIVVGLTCVSYYALYFIYSSLSDPVMGSSITDMFSSVLSQYGIPIEVFSRIMNQ